MAKGGHPTLFDLPRALHRGEYGCCTWCGKAGSLDQGERHGVWEDLKSGKRQWWCRGCFAKHRAPKAKD